MKIFKHISIMILFSNILLAKTISAESIEDLNARALSGKLTEDEKIKLKRWALDQISVNGDVSVNIHIPKSSIDSAKAIFEQHSAPDRQKEENVQKIIEYVRDSLFRVKYAKLSKKYSEIIDVQNWGEDEPGYSVNHSAYFQIYQILNNYALYRSEKHDGILALPLKGISGGVFQGKTLESSANYLGKIKESTVKNIAGFPVDVAFYDILDIDISDEQVLSALSKMTEK